MLKVIFLVEGELSFAFFCPFGYIPHPLDAPVPGSMGTKSYIVKGKGCADSYCSCSHGAGRALSRNKAKLQFTLDDLIKQTAGVECRKDAGILDEIPGAYKPIDAVMAQQEDLVDVVATLKQVVCVKG
jgi:tRNA-splicing ligase RtcB